MFRQPGDEAVNPPSEGGDRVGEGDNMFIPFIGLGREKGGRLLSHSAALGRN